MRRIAHLSDLHFGRTANAVLGPLRECVRRIEPHVVVVSGDLTAEAKPAQFRDARAFLDTLPGPQVVVPGSSDIAASGFLRFAPPFGDYRRYVNEDLEPEYADDRVAVIGVSDGDARGARTRIHGLDARIVKVVAANRPLVDSGADIVLAGSNHELGEQESPTPLVVQSGTSPVGTARTEIFSWNALFVDGADVTVERWSWNGHTRRFEAQGRETYGLPRS